MPPPRHRFRPAATALGLVAGLIMAVVVAVAGPAGEAQAKAKIKCKQTTGTAAMDPIVHHNAARSQSGAHLHQFFGNNAWLKMKNPNAADYADLVGKTTNCVNKADTAGYWIPALKYISGPRTGQLVPTKAFIAYYRSYDGADFGPGRAFPADTRLVASDNYGTGARGWSCGQFSGSGRSQRIPDCSQSSGSPGDTLTAHINFPSCWDGVRPRHSASQRGDTRDNAHYTYPVKGKGCPAAFPIEMVQLRETIQFAYTGPGNDVALTSDAHAGTTDGQSMHADFWNAWNQAGFERMVRNCVTSNTGAAECG
jgi:hypothetical protein